MAKKRNITKLPRLPQTELRKPIRAYANAVGELVWASNFLLTACNSLFVRVASPEPKDAMIAINIWTTGKTDSAQLDMLEAATLGSVRLTPKMRSKILWVVKNAQKLAVVRNDAVHSATGFVTAPKPIKVVPLPIYTKEARFKRLKASPNLIKLFKQVKGDLFQLGLYAHNLWISMSALGPFPLPHRPRLRSISK